MIIFFIYLIWQWSYELGLLFLFYKKENKK